MTQTKQTVRLNEREWRRIRRALRRREDRMQEASFQSFAVEALLALATSELAPLEQRATGGDPS